MRSRISCWITSAIRCHPCRDTRHGSITSTSDAARSTLFVAFEPLTGQRTVTVTERRGNAEFVAQLQALELRYEGAEKISLVLDQLSTHTPAALYQHLPAEEARRLTRRFEWIYTPKHASWLNMRAGPIRVPFCPRRPNWNGQRCNDSVWVSDWRPGMRWSGRLERGKQTATRGLSR